MTGPPAGGPLSTTKVVIRRSHRLLRVPYHTRPHHPPASVPGTKSPVRVRTEPPESIHRLRRLHRLPRCLRHSDLGHSSLIRH
jgi:hypothetical protein